MCTTFNKHSELTVETINKTINKPRSFNHHQKGDKSYTNTYQLIVVLYSFIISFSFNPIKKVENATRAQANIKVNVLWGNNLTTDPHIMSVLKNRGLERTFGLNLLQFKNIITYATESSKREIHVSALSRKYQASFCFSFAGASLFSA